MNEATSCHTVAACLSREETLLRNVPTRLTDIRILIELLRSFPHIPLWIALSAYAIWSAKIDTPPEPSTSTL